MGKSSKKSAVEVQAPAPDAPLLKKGKRNHEEETTKAIIIKKQKKGVVEVAPKKKEKTKTKHMPQKKKKIETSSSEEASESEEEVPAAKTALPSKRPVAKETEKKQAAKVEESSDDSEESSEESDKEPQNKKLKVPKSGKVSLKPEKKHDVDEDDSSDESSDDEPVKAQLNKKVADAPTNESSSEEEDSADEESKDEPTSKLQKQVPAAKIALLSKRPAAKEIEVTDAPTNESSSEEEDSSDVESKDEPPSKKASKKKEKYVNTDDAKEEDANGSKFVAKSEKKDISEKKDFKSTQSDQTGAPRSKNIFVGNLSFNAGREDVAEFFKEAGDVVDVRLAVDSEGQFRGFGHVEFSSEKDAEKALALNGLDLLGRSVRIDLAREKGSYTPHSGGKDSGTFQNGGKGSTYTIFIKGFNKGPGEDEIRSSLEDYFGSCGDISRVFLPKDRETGDLKGMAYIDFSSQDSLKQALELDQSEFGGYNLTVEEARPRNQDGGRGGGRGRGGRSRGGGWSGGGRRGGRGDFGRGRGGGRSRGGRGSSAAFGSQGKKTTFGDDE